ncbi:MAG: S8 family peptidase [Chitinophagaceae bacterium]|nr:S8 family peptidase [Chitinophagaceae bacterium]MCW5904692.1 S8 family peptidase [Chitinophagaceae bacterium]
MKQFLLSLFLLFSIVQLQAQNTRYIIQFKNKADNSYSINNPSAYLSQKAIDRRVKYQISIDSTDLPITSRYIDSIRLSGNVIILNKSKWLNQITIKTTDINALNKINNFPFVENITDIAARQSSTKDSTLPLTDNNRIENIFTNSFTTFQRTEATQNFYNYGATLNEIELHNGQFLHNIGMRGQNMLVAVIDAGFLNYTTLRSFDSMNLNNRVKETWDFVDNEASVVEDHSHGMSCLSTIVGNIPNTFIGNAPETNVLLYRTEEGATEYPIEEFNWVCAAERADSAGADILTTSLGYTTFDNAAFNHTYSNMNGRTTVAAKGGVFAHRKGMLLFSAMGNDGNNSWKYLSTPADIDSTIAVGAVNASGTIGSFSSYGPSADGRIKPEASAVGVAAYVQTPSNAISAGNGTSYACPKMAGLGTCLWQAFPEFNNYTIRNAIIQSGSMYHSPDNRKGYGIPDMKTAFSLLLQQYATITNATNNNCIVSLQWKSKDAASMLYKVERKVTGDSTYVTIKTIAGSNNILSNKNYSLTDTVIMLVASGTATYRVKQIIDTASESYTTVLLDSVILSINNCDDKTEKITVLPNPTRGNSVLKIQTPYAIPNVWIRITDMRGSIVSQRKEYKPVGIATYTLPTEFLAKGIYIVSVYNDNKLIESKKIIKQ